MKVVALQAFDVVCALGWGATLTYLFWPWDLRGRRRVVKLKRGRRDWE